LVGVLVLIATAFVGAQSYEAGTASYTTAAGRTYQNAIPDSVAYLQMADSHHGGPGSDLRPFTSRVVAPTLAGLFPVDAGIGLQIVNLSFLCLGLVALAALVASWVRRTASLVVAVLLFATALPVLRYGMSLMVDGAAVGAVAIGIWVIQRRPLWNGLAVVVIALLVKESALVLVPFAIATEFCVRPPGTRRVARSAAWCVAGIGGLALASLAGRSSPMLFMPWLPRDLHYLHLTMQLNVSRRSAWVLTAATLLVPLASIVIAMVSMRRRWLRLEPLRVVPFAVGACAAVGLCAWAAVAALWDMRSAWMVVPFGVPVAAQLVDAVLQRGVHSTVRDLRTRRVALVLGLAGLAAVLTMVVVRGAFFVKPFVTDESAEHVTTQTESWSSTKVIQRKGSGHGTFRVSHLTADQPVVLDLTLPSPQPVRITLSGSSAPVFDARLDGRGTFLLQSDDHEPTLTVDTRGPWSVRLRSTNTLGRWNVVSAVTGRGPNVLLIPGGSNMSVGATFTSASSGSHFALVDDCLIPHCPSERGGVLPIGLKVLVIDEPGEWSVWPERAHAPGEEVGFADLTR
jgi:hypothetical protein